MDDLEEAVREAERRAAIQRDFTPEECPPEERPAIYILEGCYCAGQGSGERRYHVHTFTEAAYLAWCARWGEAWPRLSAVRRIAVQAITADPPST